MSEDVGIVPIIKGVFLFDLAMVAREVDVEGTGIQDDQARGQPNLINFRAPGARNVLKSPTNLNTNRLSGRLREVDRAYRISLASKDACSGKWRRNN